MTNYVTDPALLEQLNSGGEYVTDPALLAQLNGSATVQSEPYAGELAARAVAPSIAGYAAELAGPGVTNVARGIGNAIYEAGTAPAVSAIKKYISNPIANIGVDLASTAMGVPVPPMATAAAFPYAKAVTEKYKDVMNYARELTPAAENAIRKSSSWLDVHATPGEMRQIYEQLQNGNFNKFTVPERLAGSAEAKAFEEAVRSAGPSIMSRLGTTLTTVARTAARVAGPVGMGMDLYEAGKVARETQLGDRLARGEGARAQQAYRQIPSQINTPANPMPGTPAFAQLQQQYDQQKQMQQDRAALSQPPAAQNFIERMRALSNLYGGVKQ